MATYSERLPEMLQTAEEHGADFVVIDTPPNTRPPVLESAKAADLVVIPCKPDRVSIEAIGSTISLIETAKVPARIVLNGVEPLRVSRKAIKSRSGNIQHALRPL